jgi:predicted phage terminase large subunit-like protein
MNNSALSLESLRQIPIQHLVQQANRELAYRNLRDFIPWASPHLRVPDHLPELLESLQRTIDGPQRGLFSTPPQFGKTTAIQHGLVWHAWRRPRSSSAYVTYGSTLTRKKAAETVEIARAAGLEPKGNLEQIRLANGSSIIFTSIGGRLEGDPITGILVFDDPYEDRPHAESAAERQRVEDKWFSTGVGRIHESTSRYVIHHRWTGDDLIAQLEKEGWAKWVNYPAIKEDGTSLWPSLKSLDFLHGQRDEVGPFRWESEYLGIPRPRGMRMFEGLNTYRDLPSTYKVAVGVDCATSSKQSADYSAYVVMARDEDRYYIIDVQRYQCSAPDFGKKLLGVQTHRPKAPMAWYAATSEIGHGQFIKTLGVNLSIKSANQAGDKGIRALPLSAAWAREKVFLPTSAPWLNDFLDELYSFTGSGKDRHDDMVDAAASAFDLLATTTSRPSMVSMPRLGSWNL